MIKLAVNGDYQVTSDTNLSNAALPYVRFIEFKKRGEGVGGGFNGRAPNRVIIDLGDRDYRAVPLPDNFDPDRMTIKSIQLVDTNDLIKPVNFEQSENLRVWNAVQPETPQQSIQGSGDLGGATLQFEIEDFFKNAIPAIKKCGVNVIGRPANMAYVEMSLHKDDAQNEEYIRAIDALAYDFSEQHMAKHGGVFGINVQVKSLEETGTGYQPQNTFEGKLVQPDHPEHAAAGRNPVKVESRPGISAQNVAAVKPFTEGSSSGEKILRPGQTDEPYGSVGPHDEEAAK